MNSKAIIVIIFGTVVIIGGLSWFGRPETKPIDTQSDVSKQAASLLAAQETMFDFGQVSMAKGNVSHMYKIRNNGLQKIMLNKLYTSCMCTTAQLNIAGGKYGPFGMPGHGMISSISAALDPGAEAEVEVVFDPAAHGPAGVGRIERVITLENNAGSPLELRFSAIVTP